MTNKKTAALILNRNLPEVAEKVRSSLLSAEENLVDVFIIESGSDVDKLAPNYSFYADWPDAIENGLRYPNGMNYGISKILESHPQDYDSFLLLANDIIFRTEFPVTKLRETLFTTPCCGLVSPCGFDWGEKLLIKDHPKAFWHIHNNCYMISKDFLDSISPPNSSYKDILFDGTNFRGYCSDTELIAKGYVNGYQSVITSDVEIDEDTSLLKERYSIIKTDSEDKNWSLYLEEGLLWIKRKYSFNSRWDMNNYSFNLYCQFFKSHPGLDKYNIIQY